MSTNTARHEPWPMTVETFEDVGGVLISEGVSVQVRCACTDDLGHDFGHEVDR